MRRITGTGRHWLHWELQILNSLSKLLKKLAHSLLTL